jgi:hypothetical protein
LFSIKCQLILIGKQLGDNRLGVNSGFAQVAAWFPKESFVYIWKSVFQGA